LEVHEVFEFSEDGTDFWPSQRFRNDMIAPKYPFLVMFWAVPELADQLLLHEIRPEHPFEAMNGADPVTMQFQSVGPVKFDQLARTHNVLLTIESDPDIFIIKCEGFHCMGETTPALKQATFSLSQMVSMTVLVMKEQVNHGNIDNVRSLFILSHAFSRDLPGFLIGTTIMMREVGIRYPRGARLSLQQRDEYRQQSDVKQRTAIMNVLNRERLKFSERDLIVLGQPGFEEEDVYWKSMEDFLRFTAAIMDGRQKISGQSLLQLFNEAKPSIMQVTDFANPSIPFETIMQNITIRYLKEAGLD
jgi:hypothetical protein